MEGVFWKKKRIPLDIIDKESLAMRKHIAQFRQAALQLQEDATAQVFMMPTTSINNGINIKRRWALNNISSSKV